MNSLRLREQVYGWLLAGPFVLTLVVFFLYALVRTVYFSFTEYDLFSEAVWVGLNNFVALFKDDLFLLALGNTVAFSVIVTVIQTVLALGLAILVNSKIRGKSFFRTAFYLPSILSSAAVTLIFIWFYQKNGYLNGFLTSVAANSPYLTCFVITAVICQLVLVWRDRIRGLPASWFDPAWAILSCMIAAVITLFGSMAGLVEASSHVVEVNWLNTREDVGPMPLTLWAIVIQNIYTTIPTFMLLFLAGLQGIPEELYEATRIDGAKKWQQHWHITIPQLAPVTFVVITFGIIGTLQMFDQVALLGAAAPLESRITLAYYVYHNAFPPGGTPQIGMASAASLVLAFITLVVVYIQKIFGVKEKADV
ncbi:sugar ABC transporter permease [Photobacterium sp. BZF1]|uniref:carbohydrate ABC transporter permease n=1 Tax=Photobacterium sp. BZF1 TaxID=1904457 RepID=UPI001653D93A|nr:sugar ABC transporter permease [Photobacterium sp. BZF1]MBC7004823.1 sugar ABC transporter permease [Photobacterium sp. BZF1]